MSEIVATSERIDSWKDISSYLGRDVSTVIRWEKERGLPIRRIPGGQRQGVFAYRQEIDDWLNNESGKPEAIGCDVPSPVLSSAPVVSAPLAIEHRRFRSSIYWLGGVAVVATITALAAYFWHSVKASTKIRIDGVAQITSDGTRKRGLVTDGIEVYFDEFRDGKTILAAVPVTGGSIRIVTSTLLNAVPQAISPDGKRLLVLNQDGKEEERSLWIVQASGAGAKQLGNIHCHSAAWGPLGNQIAYASGNALYVTTVEGTTPRLIHQFSAIPERPQWSLDGRRIYFELRDSGTGQLTFWEVALAGDKNAHMTSLVPLNVTAAQYPRYLAILDDADQAFIASGGARDGRISLLAKESSFSDSHFLIRELDTTLYSVGMLALNRRSRKLFTLSTVHPNADLLRYDQALGSTDPFLPGLSATDLDYSRDGQWLTYVKDVDGSLWVSRSDGSQPRQIVSPATEIELPRWSPDGRRIAFMGKVVGKPWRIYLISPSDGKVQEASTGTDDQGAPTWSPDGTWLIYGNVECQKSGTCAIHKINLATGRESTVPDSDGLGTARWSPDGRSIGALQPERHQVYVFDLASQEWKKLADSVTGNDLNWSQDSRYLFASNPIGNRPGVIRIRLQDGKVESAVDLSLLAKLSGSIDSWFGIAPDGAIILRRAFDANEIFALNYSEK